MERVFVDANIFIAVLDQGDADHLKAKYLLAKVQERALFPVTSNFVVSETLTVLNQGAGKKTALFFAEAIYHPQPKVETISVNLFVEQRALEYFKNIKSKNVSFVDCTSFAIMELYSIRYAMTFDKDFKKKGLPFEVLS